MTTAKRRCLHHGRALTLNAETVIYPDGRQEELEIVRHPGGAAAVAVDDEARICLIRQYRYAADGWLWEIPAGRLEHDESPLACARRELAEEAGVTAADWRPLGQLLPSPGVCDERIHLFLARGLQRVATAHETGEYIEIHWLAPARVQAMLCAGEIVDAKTLVALQNLQSCPPV